MAPWARSPSPYYGQTLEALGKTFKFRMDDRWADLSEAAKNVILYGSGDKDVLFSYADGVRAYEVKKPFEGVIRNLERRYLETESDWAREEISRFMSARPCDACAGFRLKPEALAVKIDQKHIGEISELSVRDAAFGSKTCRKSLT